MFNFIYFLVTKFLRVLFSYLTIQADNVIFYWLGLFFAASFFFTLFSFI